MFVVADVGAMRAASRDVVHEAGSLTVAVDLSGGAGPSVAAALTRAESRLLSSLHELARRFSDTASAVDVAAVGYDEVDRSNADRIAHVGG